MRERLTHTIHIRLPPSVYETYISFPGNKSEFARGAIVEAILHRKSEQLKVNLAESRVSTHAVTTSQ